MSGYDIEYTELAKAFAAKHGGVTAIEERIRGEVAECGSVVRCGNLTNLVMTSVEIGDDWFICRPLAKDRLLVDTATVRRADRPLERGLFAGFTVEIPVPDSDDR